MNTYKVDVFYKNHWLFDVRHIGTVNQLISVYHVLKLIPDCRLEFYSCRNDILPIDVLNVLTKKLYSKGDSNVSK